MARLLAAILMLTGLMAPPLVARADLYGPALVSPPPFFVRTSDDAPIDPALTALNFATSEETARLLWDMRYHELVDRATADVIANVKTPRDVLDAVQKWRFVEGLSLWAAERPLAFRPDPDDGHYRLGDNLFLEVTQPSPDYRFLTVLNIASTGEVQFIFPAPGHVATGQDIFDPVTGEARLGPSPVTEPIGADHVVAIASTQRLNELHRVLGALNGQRAVVRLGSLLKTHAGDAGKARVAVLAIFTEKR